MAGTLQAVHRWGWEHWLHIPHRKAILRVAVGLALLLAAAAGLSQLELRRPSAPGRPVPAVVERNLAAAAVPAAPPALEAATAPEAAEVVIKIEEPIIIRGTIPRR